MRRRHALGPLLLFSGSCVTGPYTQSTNFLARAEDVPGARSVLLPPFTDAYAAWQLPPQNPWARYHKATLLASLEDTPTEGLLPDVSELEIVRRAREAGAVLALAGLPADTMWVLDLRGAAAVALGTTLSHQAQAPVSLVLTFNNWPAPEELVPAEETLSALVSMRPRPPDPFAAGSRPVFLLDAWRLAYREAQPDDEVFDNRYVLNAGDLPGPEVLRLQGIRQVVYVIESRGEDTVEEDDLHAVFLAYQQAGITLALVDLSDLLQLADGTPPQPWLGRHGLYVRLRSTLLGSPSFYARAHGGFGGPHARPSHFGHFGFGGGFRGPSHGGG